MIPRILVPKNARPVAASSDAPPRRLHSELDARTLVPSNLPHIELDPRTSIPSHIPLGVLLFGMGLFAPFMGFYDPKAQRRPQ